MVTAHGESCAIFIMSPDVRAGYEYSQLELRPSCSAERKNWRESAGCVLNEACQRVWASSIPIPSSCPEIYENSSAAATGTRYYPALARD